MSDLFGWDLIYKLSENDLKKKEDVLTLFIHYLLIKAGYKCIGLGDDRVLTGNEVSSETLPVDWNRDSSYSIRYCLNSGLYILKGIPVDNNIIYNLVNGSDVKVTNVAFNVDSTVATLKGDLGSLIPSHEGVMKQVQSELLGPMANGNTKEATTQATGVDPPPGSQGSRGPRRDGFHDPIPASADHRGAGYDPDRDPLRVGRSDLDPFAPGGGGGMIFNPFGRDPPYLRDPSFGLGGPHLPRGAVPPGARFDPFGPVLPNPPRPRRPPGSDEFHPPGFGGDMFM